MTKNLTIGGLIRERRIAQALSLGQLASRLGVPPASVRAWERGDEPLPPKLAASVADALGLDAAALIDTTAPPEATAAAKPTPAPKKAATPVVAPVKEVTKQAKAPKPAVPKAEKAPEPATAAAKTSAEAEAAPPVVAPKAEKTPVPATAVAKTSAEAEAAPPVVAPKAEKTPVPATAVAKTSAEAESAPPVVAPKAEKTPEPDTPKAKATTKGSAAPAAGAAAAVVAPVPAEPKSTAEGAESDIASTVDDEAITDEAATAAIADEAAEADAEAVEDGAVEEEEVPFTDLPTEVVEGALVAFTEEVTQAIPAVPEKRPVDVLASTDAVDALLGGAMTSTGTTSGPVVGAPAALIAEKVPYWKDPNQRWRYWTRAIATVAIMGVFLAVLGWALVELQDALGGFLDQFSDASDVDPLNR